MARAVVYMAGLPLDANVLTMTVMATACRTWDADNSAKLHFFI